MIIIPHQRASFKKKRRVSVGFSLGFVRRLHLILNHIVISLSNACALFGVMPKIDLQIHTKRKKTTVEGLSSSLQTNHRGHASHCRGRAQRGGGEPSFFVQSKQNGNCSNKFPFCRFFISERRRNRAAARRSPRQARRRAPSDGGRSARRTGRSRCRRSR